MAPPLLERFGQRSSGSLRCFGTACGPQSEGSQELAEKQKGKAERRPRGLFACTQAVYAVPIEARGDFATQFTA
jgi:hypothetical protein